MKRERRHELQTNALADWLAGVVSAVKPYANTILAVVLVVGLVALAASWWTRRSAGGTEQAWDAFNRVLNTGTPAEFDELIEKYPGTDVAHWAGVLAGDVYLSSGCDRVLTSKATASQDLQKAVDHYLTVRNESSAPMLRERATFGLARAYEALSGTRRAGGDMQEAIKFYEEVVKEWPNGAYDALAARRLEELKTHDTKSFYDKLVAYDPNSAFSEGPGASGKRLPFSPESLPEEKPLYEKRDLLKAGGPVEKPSVPKGSSAPASKAAPAKTPAPGDTQPAETKPSPSAPAQGPEPALPKTADSAKGAASAPAEPAASEPAKPAKPDKPADEGGSGKKNP